GGPGDEADAGTDDVADNRQLAAADGADRQTRERAGGDRAGDRAPRRDGAADSAGNGRVNDSVAAGLSAFAVIDRIAHPGDDRRPNRAGDTSTRAEFGGDTEGGALTARDGRAGFLQGGANGLGDLSRDGGRLGRWRGHHHRAGLLPAGTDGLGDP